jgi:hypothetical protein
MLVLPMTGNPGVIAVGWNGPIPRVVYIGPIGPNPFTFNPYVTGRRARRVDIHGYDRLNADIKPLGVGLVGGPKSQPEGKER